MGKNGRALSTPAGKERLPGTPVSRARSRFLPALGMTTQKSKSQNAGISQLRRAKSRTASVEMTTLYQYENLL